MPSSALSRIAPPPALATPRRFSDPAWIYEPRRHGTRVLALRSGGDVWLLDRDGRDVAPLFPEVVLELARQRACDVAADGKIADDGGSTGPVLHLFDLLRLDGADLTGLSLRARKGRLRRAFRWGGALRFVPHRNGAGEEVFREACRRGFEGVVARHAEGRYPPGRPGWLWFRCDNREELVIGGYTADTLLVGTQSGGRLRFAGKVGTGYDEEMIDDLRRILARWERTTAPFADALLPRAGVHWVEPRMTARVAYTDWTPDGHLRRARLIGPGSVLEDE